MIAASLLLIAGAVTLLVMGLWQSSSVLLGASIAASVLAAVVLIVGARRMPLGADLAAHPDPGLDDLDRGGGYPQEPYPGPDHRDTQPIPVTRAPHAPPERQPVAAAIPAQQVPAEQASVDDEDEDPPDEPSPQQVSPADAARVGQMHTEVLVVDGRPRYHMPGCVHLLGRDSEPLPVGEAIELGFTPCSLCEPDSALLADARRV